MKKSLHYQTVIPFLLSTLRDLMQAQELKLFRLVGGTSLSLQIGIANRLTLTYSPMQNMGLLIFRLLISI